MGTGGTINGVSRYLKEKNPNIKIIGVDPIGSLYYDFVKSGKVGKATTYVIEGIGEDFFPGTMNLKIVDDVIQVNDEECFVWARRLAKKEGMFTGGSGGGCVRRSAHCEKRQEGRFHRRISPRHRNALHQQDLQRRLDAGACHVDAEVAISAADVIRVKHQNGKSRELVIVRPYQTVFHALQTMQKEDISQLPVLEDDNHPIGTVYEDQILTLALQGKDLRKLVIREVMGAALPQVPATAPVERITHILSHDSPAVFVEMPGGKLEVLTKFDLMDTISGLVSQSR